MTMKANSRQVNGVTVIDLSGSITSEEGSRLLRNTVQEISSQGQRNILLNLGEITRVDTSGIGELVSAFTAVRNAGGDLKFFNPTREVSDLLQITKLSTVFDVQEDEASAIAAFQAFEDRVAERRGGQFLRQRIPHRRAWVPDRRYREVALRPVDDLVRYEAAAGRLQHALAARRELQLR